MDGSSPRFRYSSLDPTAAGPSHFVQPPSASALSLRRNFQIVLPRLSNTEKAQYVPITDLKVDPNSLVEVVGRTSYRDVEYYFARKTDGQIYKFSIPFMKSSFQYLIDEYEKRVDNEGTVSFDPASENVHPDSRTSLTFEIASHSTTSVADSDEAQDFEEEQEQEESSEASSAPGLTRYRQKKLPYSPRKTRSQKVFPVHDSDSEDELNRAPTRQSSRAKRVVRINSGDNDDDEFEESDSSAYAISERFPRKPQNRQALRRKPSRPVYGHIRSVDELESEDEPDNNEAIMRRHRRFCERCQNLPAHIMLESVKKKGKSRKKKGSDDDLEVNMDEEIYNYGGWIRCLRCPVSAHWHCIAKTQQEEILKAAKEKDWAQWLKSHPNEESLIDKIGPKKRVGVELQNTTEFICASCMKGGTCMGCSQIVASHDVTPIPLGSGATTEESTKSLGMNTPPVFRCLTCKRISHYSCLPALEDDTENRHTYQHYQTNWLCTDCASLKYKPEKILAWKPALGNAVEPPPSRNIRCDWKTPLPREYLIKWKDRSYRRTTWVSHMWLSSTSPALLRSFLQNGPKPQLLAPVKDDVEDASDLFNNIETPIPVKPSSTQPYSVFDAMPDAESKIPISWKTVNRVLDILIWAPPKWKGKGKGKVQSSHRVESDFEENDSDEDLMEMRKHTMETGEEPPEEYRIKFSEFEDAYGRNFTSDDTSLIAWMFVKWDDLGYEDASWDSPPESIDPLYLAYETALRRFLAVQTVHIDPKARGKFEDRHLNDFKRHYTLKKPEDLQLGQAPELKLMPFQVDGFNWLCDNWYNRQNCILADEMGLGKTVQIASFLGNITKSFHAFPALVIVPNSTITNWVREIERWAPELRVVPFYGEAKAREIIKSYELYHNPHSFLKRDVKYHILLATFDSVLNQNDFSYVFKSVGRWEVLVVDEGQRLKNDSSSLFKKLNELKTLHRIIMTGTPLNNNIRELFNLMNFLDPGEWNNLQALEKEYEVLSEDLVKELHARLRPYFLRRIKSEVLKLPPKNEVIIPLSMAPLQKEVYRSILSHNLDILNGLVHKSGATTTYVKKNKLSNVLMHLRKCIQHPYLYDDAIEPSGLRPAEAHEKLIGASAKLRLLKTLLPKLKARGHRVLLFSQFVIALNIVEDFLIGEGFKYLRLDGSTGGMTRQRDMDEFNRPNSDVFIYLLSTRAGGVGINLFTADTVIIYDPDFNPHQDLQAVARAHRFGQKKPCMVFRLMVKDSAEERIMQIAKKKLVLDHLIVQKMDDEDGPGENIHSILSYGAKALFDSDEGTRDITYSDHDIDSLIEKTEKDPGEQTAETSQSTNEGALFSFAKIWTQDATFEEVPDIDQGDSWAQTIEMINAEREKFEKKEIVQRGRGVKRAAALHKNYYAQDSPGKGNRQQSEKSGRASSDSSAYHESEHAANESESDDTVDEIQEPEPSKELKQLLPLNPAQGHSQGQINCGLCGSRHKEGVSCQMVDKSENLVEYREMLMLHADDEPLETRIAAIRAIEETLYQRGHGHLLIGQPLKLVYPQVPLMGPPPRSSKPCPQPIMKTARSSQHASGSQQVASSSKRAPSPTPLASSALKRPKTVPVYNECPICKQAPHDIRSCPVVKEGPHRVAHEIKRLTELPGMVPIASSLRKILSQMKKLEDNPLE